MDHPSFSKVKVPRLEEDIFGNVNSLELYKMDKVAEFSTGAPTRPVEIFAWDRPVVLRETSKSVEVILEGINRGS